MDAMDAMDRKLDGRFAAMGSHLVPGWVYSGQPYSCAGNCRQEAISAPAKSIASMDRITVRHECDPASAKCIVSTVPIAFMPALKSTSRRLFVDGCLEWDIRLLVAVLNSVDTVDFDGRNML